MPAGRLRLWTAAVAFLACGVSPPAAAQESPVDACDQVGDVAELIMRERQHGATMDDLMRIELQMPEELRGIVEIASEASFAFPQKDTEQDREAAVQDFRAWMQTHFCPQQGGAGGRRGQGRVSLVAMSGGVDSSVA